MAMQKKRLRLMLQDAINSVAPAWKDRDGFIRIVYADKSRTHRDTTRFAFS